MISYRVDSTIKALWECCLVRLSTQDNIGLHARSPITHATLLNLRGFKAVSERLRELDIGCYFLVPLGTDAPDCMEIRFVHR